MAVAVVMRYAAGSVITGQQLFHLISGEPDVVVYVCVCESAAHYEGGAYVDWTGMGIIASNGLLQPEKGPKLPPCKQRFLRFLTEELNELIAGYL